MEQQQQEDEAPPPPLLSALQRLDDAAWRSLLLPLLTRRHGLALTCRALRALWQRTQQRLVFGGQDMQDAALTLVPERFPACTDVRLNVHSKADAVDALPALLPVLARLPSFTRLTLDLSSGTDITRSMPLMLQLVCKHLPQLCALALQSRTSSWSSNARIWRVLGSMTQLSSLELVLWGSADDSLQHMTALSGLTGLQHLDVQADTPLWRLGGVQHHGYLASLGALTHLAVPLASADGLGDIGACTNLRHLQLWRPGLHAALRPQLHDTAPLLQLDDAACAGLQRLAQLTCLQLGDVIGTDSLEFASALRAMPQLERLEVPVTRLRTMAALAGLSRLTRLKSSWAPGGAAAAGVQPTAAAVCASVREVDLRGAGIPWSVFPGATSIKQCESWAPADFVAISTHCRQLAALEQSVSGGCMVASAPAIQRAAGIRSLAELTALTSLEWRANDDAELTALATLSSLRSLEVACDSSDQCTWAGAQALATARQLSSVKLNVWALQAVPAAADVMALLASLKHLRRLTIICNYQHRAVLKQGLAAARAAGVAVPGKVSLLPY